MMRCLTINECNRWRDEHCRRHEWKRQITCFTRLERLPWFSAALVEPLAPFDHALLIVDAVVAGDVPPKLEKLRREAGELRPVYEAPGHAFENEPDRLQTVLAAALSGVIDLRVLFYPSMHALRADHDEFTTIFSESSGKIADVRRMLTGAGVELLEHTAKSP